ncbi:MAG: RNA polymerase sigma factor [Phycisphaerae bacterium]
MAGYTTRLSLLAKVRDRQDTNAWRRFDRTYGDLVVRYCLNNGLQLSDAEDVRQSVMIQLANSMPEFRYKPSRGRFRHYLRATVRHAIYRTARRKQIQTVPIQDSDCDSMANQTDPAWDRAWIDHHYSRAIAKLRKQCKQESLDVFDRYLAGDSTAQIAAAFKKTPDAVRRIRDRLRDRLRQLIAEQLEEEPS